MPALGSPVLRYVDPATTTQKGGEEPAPASPTHHRPPGNARSYPREAAVASRRVVSTTTRMGPPQVQGAGRTPTPVSIALGTAKAENKKTFWHTDSPPPGDLETSSDAPPSPPPDTSGPPPVPISREPISTPPRPPSRSGSASKRSRTATPPPRDQRSTSPCVRGVSPVYTGGRTTPTAPSPTRPRPGDSSARSKSAFTKSVVGTPERNAKTSKSPLPPTGSTVRASSPCRSKRSAASPSPTPKPSPSTQPPTGSKKPARHPSQAKSRKTPTIDEPVPALGAVCRCDAQAEIGSEVRFMLYVPKETEADESVAGLGKGRVWAAERMGSVTVRDEHDPTHILHTIRPNNKGEHGIKVKAEDLEFCWTMVHEKSFHQVWTGWSTGCLRVYNSINFELIASLHHHAGGVYCLTAAGGSVFSGSNDFEIHQWDAETLEFLKQYSGHGNAVRALSVCGSELYSASDDHTIRVWNLITGDLVKQLTGPHCSILALAVCPVRHRLWSGDENGSITVWDPRNDPGKEVIKVLSNQHRSRVQSLLLLEDRVVSAGVDRALCVFDAVTLQPAGRYPGHQGYINHLCMISRCLQFQVWSCSSDKTFATWRVSTGCEEACGASSSDFELIRALQEQVKSLGASLDKANAKFGDREDAWQRSIAEKENHFASTQEGLRAQVEGLRRERRDLHEQLRLADESLKLKEGDVRHGQEQLAAQKREVERLYSLLDSAKHGASGREAALQTQIESVRSELRDQQEILLRKDRDIARKDDEIKYLEQRLVQAREESEAVAQSSHSGKRDLKECQLRCDRLVREVRDLEGKEASSIERISSLTTSLERERQAMKAQECENQRCQGEAKMLRKEIEQRVQERTGLEEKINSLQQELNEWRDKAIARDTEAQNASSAARDMQSKITELTKQKDALRMREEEMAFVLHSRTDLVKRIWDLYTAVEEVHKHALGTSRNPSLKQLHGHGASGGAASVNKDFQALLKVTGECRRQSKSVVANYLTDLEKMHLGTSPYYFQPDGEGAKYHLNETNEEHDNRLLRSGAISSGPGLLGAVIKK